MAAILTENEKHIIAVCMAEITKLGETIQGEMAKRFDERDVDLCTRLEKTIDDQISVLKTFVSTMPNTSVPGTESTGDPAKDFSFAKIAAAQLDGDWSQAEYELEIQRTMRKNGVYEKAQSLGTAGAGGFIVPEEQAESVIEKLEAEAIVFQLGARSLDGLDRSPYKFPRLTASVTAAWGTEAAAISDSDITLDEVTLAIKELRSLNLYSNMLLRTSHPSIEQVVRDDMARQFALALDLAALTGDGTGGAPTGIANQTDVLTAAVGTTLNYDTFQLFPAALRNNDSLRGSLGWAMAPETLNAILTMKDTTEEIDDTAAAHHIINTQPLARRLLSESALDRLLGYPFRTSSQLPATVGAADSVIFGNFSELWIGRWGTLELMASAHHKFANNQGALRGVLYADVAVRHPKSFVVAT